jgi:hypothetical protein
MTDLVAVGEALIAFLVLFAVVTVLLSWFRR